MALLCALNLRLFPDGNEFRRLCETVNVTQTVGVNAGLTRTLRTPAEECAVVAAVEKARE
jgi:hypothetical protein